MKKAIETSVTIMLLLSILDTAALSQGIYWTQGTYGSSKLRRATTGGTIIGDVTAAGNLNSLPQDAAIDSAGGRLYWVGGGYTGANVFRSNLELTGIDSISGNASVFRGIAVDRKGGRVYWTSTNLTLGPKIYGANLDGSGMTVLIDFYALHDSSTTPRGIAVDTVDEKLYWASDATGTIMRSNLDGSTIETVQTGLSNPVGIALDMPNGKIYWTECENPGGKVRRADLTNSGSTLSNITDLATGLASPYALAIDPSFGKVYWTELGGSTTNPRIVDANLDGSSSGVVVDNLTDPYGLAVQATADPLLTVNSASSITTSSATLTGTIIPNGSRSYAQYQYGTSTAYGNATVVDTLDDPRTALSFNGTSSYVDVGTSSVFNFVGAFTIEAWIKVSSFTSGWQAIITKGDGAWRLQRYNTSDNLDFGTSGLSSQDLQGTTNVNDGNWHHVAAVYDGSTKKLFVDGNLDAEASATGTLSTDADALYFGENAQVTGRYFHGLIDEVRIWNAALDSATLEGWKNRDIIASHPYKSSLLGYWQFDEGSGSVAHDSSGNADDGTLVNSPVWVDSTRIMSLTASVSGIAPSTIYHYRLTATNAGGTSSSSDSTFTTTALLPVEVTSLEATADIATVSLSWQTQSEVNNAGFNVLRKDRNASGFALLASFRNDNRLKGAGTSSAPKSYSFADYAVNSGASYEYRIQSVSNDGTVKDWNTVNVTVGVPKSYALYQNFPNPFNPSTTVRFDLKEPSSVRLAIFNILGQKVYAEDWGMTKAGRYNDVLGMNRFASGVYFYRITAVGISGDKFSSFRKMMLVK